MSISRKNLFDSQYSAVIRLFEDLLFECTVL